MTLFKDAGMMALCALMLSVVFLAFALLALFSETARWIIDQAMHRIGSLLSEGEARSIKRHQENISSI